MIKKVHIVILSVASILLVASYLLLVFRSLSLWVKYSCIAYQLTFFTVLLCMNIRLLKKKTATKRNRIPTLILSISKRNKP